MTLDLTKSPLTRDDFVLVVFHFNPKQFIVSVEQYIEFSWFCKITRFWSAINGNKNLCVVFFLAAFFISLIPLWYLSGNTNTKQYLSGNTNTKYLSGNTNTKYLSRNTNTKSYLSGNTDPQNKSQGSTYQLAVNRVTSLLSMTIRIITTMTMHSVSKVEKTVFSWGIS